MRLNLETAHWDGAFVALRNISGSTGSLNRRAESAAALALAQDLAKVDGNYGGVSRLIFDHAVGAIEEGRFADGKRFLSDFRCAPRPDIGYYMQGDAELCSCLGQFYQGTLSESDWQRAYELAVQHRNVTSQYQFLSLRSELLLTKDQPGPALDAIDEALKIVNRLGTPRPDYHDLRAWALAKLGRAADARSELANGEKRRYAAEAWLVLGDCEQARTCALNAYRWAWGEGPPYIHWYELERSRALLRELGEPEPQLPPFDPSKVKPIPYEAEIRAAIAKLKAEKAAKNDKKADT